MAPRTVSLFAVLVFGLFLTAGRHTALAGEANYTEVSILLRFDNPPSTVFVSTMERELARILVPAGLRLRWTTPEEAGVPSLTSVLVFRFHGACKALPGQPEATAPEPSRRITLADTAVAGSSILPYTEVNCDRLRGFLANEGPAGAGVESRLGFAMARVVAHEMYHVLLETREHGKKGITQAVYTPSGLLSRALRFESDEMARIRARLAEPLQNISFKPN